MRHALRGLWCLAVSQREAWRYQVPTCFHGKTGLIAIATSAQLERGIQLAWNGAALLLDIRATTTRKPSAEAKGSEWLVANSRREMATAPRSTHAAHATDGQHDG